MESINLDPRYSTSEIPGRCVKCLAEQELNNCLLELLRGNGENRELEERFEALVSFLKAPGSAALRDEAEKYLAEGKQVRVKINLETDEPSYELIVE